MKQTQHRHEKNAIDMCYIHIITYPWVNPNKVNTETKKHCIIREGLRLSIHQNIINHVSTIWSDKTKDNKFGFHQSFIVKIARNHGEPESTLFFPDFPQLWEILGTSSFESGSVQRLIGHDVQRDSALESAPGGISFLLHLSTRRLRFTIRGVRGGI